MTIKFRAWDGERMKPINTIGWTNGEIDWIDTPKYHGDASDFAIMQYSGFTDTHAVYIYEGDIISFTIQPYYDGTYVEKSLTKTVEYTDGMFTLWGVSLAQIYREDDELKVIGNIYENADLLEVTK